MLNIIKLPSTVLSFVERESQWRFSVPAAVVMLSSWLAMPSLAQPYVGISIGQSEGAVQAEQSATSMEVHAGVALSQNFALEASYIDLGGVDVAGGELNLDGFAFMAVASFPVAQTMDVFAKVGAYNWDSEFSARYGNTHVEREVDSDTDFLYGFGVNFGIADGFDAVLEYRALSFDTFDEDGSNISLGVRYWFR